MTRRPLAALALVALIGAGCGSSAPSETGAATATATKTATARDKAVKFAECVRAHGVSDFPDPNAKNQFEYGVSVSPPVWNKAVSACKKLQPPGTLSGKRSPREQSGALEFARCMRDNGVKDFPDPACRPSLPDAADCGLANGLRSGDVMLGRRPAYTRHEGFERQSDGDV